MIGQTSSLIIRWTSGMIRERFTIAASSFFSAPLFNGSMSGARPQLLALFAPSSGASIQAPIPERSNDHIWFAVPKSKISRSRKRMKTTRQKRIPLKKNIVFDPRTGEVTLKHKMPFNWKEYLPKVD